MERRAIGNVGTASICCPGCGGRTIDERFTRKRYSLQFPVHELCFALALAWRLGRKCQSFLQIGSKHDVAPVVFHSIRAWPPLAIGRLLFTRSTLAASVNPHPHLE